MTTKHCRHKHLPRLGSSAAARNGMWAYSPETKAARQQSTLHNDAGDDAALAALTGDGIKSYADLEMAESIRSRVEKRMEEYNAPLARELEAIFVQLDLPPLPQPLRKGIWEPERAPWRSYMNKELSPFTTACQDGSLDVVRYWASQKKDLLRQVGLQHGLTLAAWKNQISTVSYLLREGGAYLDSAVIEMACRNLSLSIFEVAVEHGYHPNQQIPSPAGHLSTALIQCLDSVEVTDFLLTHGADPDLGPWQDFRRSPWRSVRASPPMDRQCGIALDLAVRKGNLALAELLLRHGAHVNYARPIHELIRRKIDNDNKEEWKPLLDLLCRYGADVNAYKASSGSPYHVLHFAVHMGQWGIVEELLVRGADPHTKTRPNGRDAFQIALDDKAERFLKIFERVEASRKNEGERILSGTQN